MRVLSLLVWLAVVAVLLLPLLRRREPAAADAPPALTDDLVKDPVCQTYVVRSRAVRRLSAGDPVYFCSARCAQRYE